MEMRSGWCWQGRAKDCMDSSRRLHPWVLPSLGNVGTAAWEGVGAQAGPQAGAVVALLSTVIQAG